MVDIEYLVGDEFFKTAEKYLSALIKTEAAFLTEFRIGNALLSGETDEMAPGVANSNNVPTSQVEWLDAHENLTDAMNRKLLSLSYLLKVVNHIPLLVNKHGMEYTHTISLKNRDIDLPSIDLIGYQDPNAIIEDMIYTYQYCFQYLHGYRQKITDQTWQEYQDTWSDSSFAALFMEGEPIESHDMMSVIEFLFLDEFNIPLGCLETHEDVEIWINKRVRENRSGEQFDKLVQSRETLSKFPGITLQLRNTTETLTASARHDFSTSLYGPIPQEGLVLFGGPYKPQRYKPHLKYQSPG